MISVCCKCIRLWLAAGAVLNCAAAGLDEWYLRNPIPTAEHLEAAAYGNGRFVAVGQLGTVLISQDGSNWVNSGATQHTYYVDVEFGNGVFVALDAVGSLFSSMNGQDWISRWTNAPTVQVLDSRRHVLYANGMFTVVGRIVRGTRMLTSSNGLDWSYTDYTCSPYCGFRLTSITWGQGLFVGLGQGPIEEAEHDPPTALAWTSVDGRVWNSSILATGLYARAITYGGGLFVAVGFGTAPLSPPGGRVFTSHDGTNWTAGPVLIDRFNLFAITYVNGVFVAAGDRGTIATSTNGMDWVLRDTGSWSSLFGVTCGGDKCVAVGISGGIFLSEDTETWHQVNRGTNERMFGTAFGNGRFVVAGESTVLTSTNGSDWTELRTSSEQRWFGVAYGNCRYVVVGMVGAVLLSNDGTNWSLRNTGLSYPNDMRSVIYANGRFVAVGSGGYTGFITTSEDGEHWTRTHIEDGQALTGISFGNGLFVAVGGRYSYSLPLVVLTSADGVTWIRHQTTANYAFTSVAFGNGKFVAARYDNDLSGILFYTSIDGAAWQPASILPHALVTAVTYSGGAFVAAGYNGVILSSPNGLQWTNRQSRIYMNLWNLTYGNNTFLAVGEGGTVLQSGTQTDGPPRISFITCETKRLDNGSVRLRIEGDPAINFVLEGSEDLVRWTPLQTVTNLTGLVEVIDSSAKGFAKRFYRAGFTLHLH